MGLDLHADYVSVLDSNIYEIADLTNAEPKAIVGLNFHGPLVVVNNKLEAESIHFLVGGGVATTPPPLPRHMTFRRNWMTRDLRWATATPDRWRWRAKNAWELKTGAYVVCEGNIFENNWTGADQYYILQLFAAGDTGSAFIVGNGVEIDHIQFTYNEALNGTDGISVAASAEIPNVVNRVLIKNNLFWKLFADNHGSIGFGTAVQIWPPPLNLRFEHNTFDSDHNWINTDQSNPSNYRIIAQVQIKDNVANAQVAGVTSSVGQGDNTINVFWPGRIFTHNLLAGPGLIPQYPTGNYYLTGATDFAAQFVNYPAGDYTLAPTSPGHRSFPGGGSSDNPPTDVGADIATLRTMTRGCRTGVWYNLP